MKTLIAKKFLVIGALALAAVMAFGVLFVAGGETEAAKKADKGNGSPSGSHYTLNIIGVPHGKTATMKGTKGHTIFVDLDGSSEINLTSGLDFEVLDRNGTSSDPDGDGAEFMLPGDIAGLDVDGNGKTTWSVYSRALGTPGGKAKMTLCAEKDGIDVCSINILELERTKDGVSKFDNVSGYLLYMYILKPDSGECCDLVNLFHNDYENFLWEYNNYKLRVAQLRFYPCETTVSPDPNVKFNDEKCFVGP